VIYKKKSQETLKNLRQQKKSANKLGICKSAFVNQLIKFLLKNLQNRELLT